MKIISGLARGIELTAPDGLDVRPTSVRARKALFDSVCVFQGKLVCDLFAGSGALGLEAASRGAAKVIFWDNSKDSAEHIRQNIHKVKKAGVGAEMLLLEEDALAGESYSRLASAGARPDLIFADPPYKASARAFAALANSDAFLKFAADATIIWEVPAGERGAFISEKAGLEIARFRNYEGIEFLFATVR